MMKKIVFIIFACGIFGFLSYAQVNTKTGRTYNYTITDVTEQSAPSNPSSGYQRWYANSSTHLMACLTSAGADCTPSGAGAVAFSAVTGSTNSSAAMIIGTGASLAISGSGTIAATTAAALAANPADCSGNQVANAINAAGTLSCRDSKWEACGSKGLGDGFNAIPAGTYLQFACVNDLGVTVTLTGVRCWTDNAGSSTLALANNAGTALLTGAVTCNSTKASGGAAGTQSATVTLASGDAINFTFVADGTSKQSNWTISGTF